MRPARCASLLLAVAALFVATTPPVRAADAPPVAQVTLTPADGGPARTVALSGLAGHEDVHGVRYPLRSADGTMRDVTIAAGFSLVSLLQQAGVDLDSFTYVEVSRPDGTSVLVLREQIVNPVGEAPPVVWVDGDGTHFLRSAAGPGDVNVDDLVTSPDGAIAVGLRSGQPFAVRIDASARRVRPGQPVRFSVALLAGQRTADMDFTWYFADGSASAEGARVTHRFRRSGTYLVQVNVVRSGRTLDAYDIQDVRVHAPARRSGGSVGRSGGGDAGTGGAGSGEGGSGRSDAGTGGGARGSGESGFGSAAAGGSHDAETGGATPVTAGSSPHRARPPRSASKPVSPAIPARRGTLVSGTLLASADSVPLPAGAVGSGRRDRTVAVDRPLHVPVGVWIAAVLAALLAAGWALEARHNPPFWQP